MNWHFKWGSYTKDKKENVISSTGQCGQILIESPCTRLSVSVTITIHFNKYPPLWEKQHDIRSASQETSILIHFCWKHFQLIYLVCLIKENNFKYFEDNEALKLNSVDNIYISNIKKLWQMIFKWSFGTKRWKVFPWYICYLHFPRTFSSKFMNIPVETLFRYKSYPSSGHSVLHEV